MRPLWPGWFIWIPKCSWLFLISNTLFNYPLQECSWIDISVVEKWMLELENVISTLITMRFTQVPTIDNMIINIAVLMMNFFWVIHSNYFTNVVIEKNATNNHKMSLVVILPVSYVVHLGYFKSSMFFFFATLHLRHCLRTTEDVVIVNSRMSG